MKLPLVLALALLSGCTVGGNRSVSAENDRLRALVVELEDRAKRAEGERDELSLRLAAAAKSNAAVAADGAANLPVATSLKLGFATGLGTGEPGETATYAIFYVQPLDGLRRFTQVVGTVALEVVALSEDLASDARTLGTLRLTPEAMRDTYRSGIAGTFYEVRVPLQLSAEVPRGSSVVLRAELTDAATGAMHRAEKIVRVR